MDGGSGLNILYADTLDAMGIDWARLRPSGAPFHGIVHGNQAVPLGQIDLLVTFGDPHILGGRLQGGLPRHFGTAALREVYGGSQLYVYEAEDARAARGHHCGIYL